MVFKIIGIVILSFLALVVLFLILPIRIEMAKAPDGDFNFWLKVLFFKKNLNKTVKKIMDKKDNKADQKKNKNKEKSDEKKRKKKKAEKAKKKSKKLSPADIIKLSFTAIKELFRLFGKCRVRKLKIHYTAGGSDPADVAVTYGGICAAVYPLTAFLQSKMNIKKNAEDVSINCDFESERSRFDFDIEIGLRPFWAAAAVFRIAAAYVKK